MKDYSIKPIKKYIRFNTDKVLRALKRNNIKAYKYKGLILCEFHRVKLGSEAEGYVYYNKIIVLLKRYNIEGYLLRFSDFDYSSYWNLDRPLHPHLRVDKKNVRVENLNTFAKNLKQTVRGYNLITARWSVSNIIVYFLSRRKLWAVSKFFIKDRTKLSKMLFTKE